jgi:pimeloyl-ACP methyl ester carboxylesterase
MNTALFPNFNSTIVRFIKRRSGPVAAPWWPLPIAGRAAMRIASAVAPRFALRQAINQFLTPPRFAGRDAERLLLASAEARVIDTPQGGIHAWRFGAIDRPLVVCCHGWGGRGAQFRAFVPALLDSGYQVMLFDHLGHGHSDGRQSSLAQFAVGLEAVLQACTTAGLPVAGLLGHSLGAAAIATALRRQRRNSRSVLIAPPSSVIRHSQSFAHRLGINERIRDAMQFRLEQRTGIAWQEFELPQSVARLSAPALVIHDQDDRTVGIDSGLAIARAWPGACFHPTSRLGHQRILRDPGVIEAAVDFFGGRVEFQRPPAVGERSAWAEPAPLY